MTTRLFTTLVTIAGYAVSYVSMSRKRDEHAVSVARAELLTRTLERLGGTYVKFGQILAMRQDYLPPHYTFALSRLLDEVEPFDTAVARATIEAELGARIDDLFSEFPDQPIASASFGQVYKARLRSGSLVAVKVQRPGIERVVSADLALLRALAVVVDLSTLALPSQLRDLVAEFSAWTRDELDYRREARYAHQIGRESVGDPIAVIPRVHWEKTTRRVLTLDYLEGVSLKELLGVAADADSPSHRRFVEQGISFENVASNLLWVVLRQAFLRGRFHADPHAANVIILKGNRIGLVDFGICGYLGSDLRQRLLTLMREMGREDSEAAFWASVRVLDPPDDVDLRSFRRAYRNNLDNWLSTSSDRYASLRERSALALMLSSLEIIRRHRIGVQTMVLRYYRALMLVDIVALQLAPDMSLRDEMTVALRKIVYSERRRRRERKPAEILFDLQGMLAALPARLNELMMLRREARLSEAGRRRLTLRHVVGDLLEVVAIAGAFGAAAALAWGVLAGVGVARPAPFAEAAVAAFGVVAALVGTWLARRLGQFH